MNEQVPTTPEAFAQAIRDAIADPHGDSEVCHANTDLIMEDLLIQLGYGDGVALIRQTTRWYA